MLKGTLKLLTAILVCFACASTQLTAQNLINGKNTSAGSAYSEISRFTGNNLSMFAKALGLANCQNSASKFAADSFAAALFAPEAQNCNGVSVTPISFSNTIRTKVSGTNNTVGVVYKYANAGTAPDGVKVDARVTVLAYSNNQDTNQNNFEDADTTASGFDENLQPDINQESAEFTGANSWTGSIKYRIEFFVAGSTTQRKNLTVAATSIDNDGSAGKICGADLRESVTYSGVTSPILINTFANTTQEVNGNTVLGPAANQSLIGTGSNYANAALLQNVNQFEWTYSFQTTTPTTCAAGTASTFRLGSLNLSCQITFDQNFGFTVSGNVFNDVNGLLGTPVNTVDGTGINAGGLFANLIGSNNLIVDSVSVAADGTYTFPRAEGGNYTIQISTNRGVAGTAPPAKVLPAGWVNTGENLGTGAGSDGNVNGILPITVGLANLTNANFGIEQRPTANNNTATSQSNLGGTNSHPVPAGTFSGSDTSPGRVANIRITAIPTQATSITINGTTYYRTGEVPVTCVNCAVFPTAGVIVPTNQNGNGNPTQAILVDPISNGATTVVIPYRTIDNAGVESSPTVSATASVPFTAAPTAANVTVSGNLFFNGIPLRNIIVTLVDGETNEKTYARTNADGGYSFEEEAGKTYVVQPLSAKYKFAPSNKVVSLNENLTDVDFASSAKNYRPKNDFDGDGKSDVAVYRQSEGNWYILNSGNEEMSVVKFGVETDVPVSGDFDGDGKTDVAVYRPSEGNWYILQSSDEKSLVERFGLADDKLVPADFDGDGKTDVAIYRNGFWYISRSSDGTVAVRKFGLESDVPVAADYDADGKADVAVYRPSEGVWYVFGSANGKLSAFNFGLEKDIPVAADYDGDGAIDIAQFRDNFWYIQKSVEGFTVSQFGTDGDKSIVGDYDGDGRADQTLFNDGIWTIQNSDNGSVRQLNFGLPTDIPIG